MAFASRMLQSASVRSFSASLRQQSVLAGRRSAFQAIRQPVQRRLATTTIPGVPGADAQAQTGFAKLWNSPVGPKTVHFWAPVMKWGLVLAGVSDFARPAEQLSLTQNMALMLTGSIWTRWCFVIKPRNLFLAAVNFLLLCVGTTQVTRVLLYRQTIDGKSIGEEAKTLAKEQLIAVEHLAEHPAAAIESSIEKAKKA